MRIEDSVWFQDTTSVPLEYHHKKMPSACCTRHFSQFMKDLSLLINHLGNVLGSIGHLANHDVDTLEWS